MMTFELEADPVRDRACGLTGGEPGRCREVVCGGGLVLIKKGLEHQGEESGPDSVVAARL